MSLIKSKSSEEVWGYTRGAFGNRRPKNNSRIPLISKRTIDDNNIFLFCGGKGIMGYFDKNATEFEKAHCKKELMMRLNPYKKSKYTFPICNYIMRRVMSFDVTEELKKFPPLGVRMTDKAIGK